MIKRNAHRKLLILILCMLPMLSVSPETYAEGPNDSIVLFDDFNRAELGVTGTGGAYNAPNSAGIAIYWISMNDKTVAQIENNALKLTMDEEGWYGEGVAFKDPQYKYIIMKIKGEKGGEEKLLSLNPDAKGLVNFTDFKGPDGGPIPSITKEYQAIVIDIQKSGFNLPNGFEAIHFNNTGALTVYIDEIYLSKDGVPRDISKIIPAVGDDSGISGGSDVSSGADAEAIEAIGAIETTEAMEAAETMETPADSDEADPTFSGVPESPSNDKTVPVVIIISFMVLAIAGITYNSFIRKT